VKQQEISAEVGISVGSIHSILHKDLNMVSSALQHTCILVIEGQKVPYQPPFHGFGASAIFSRLVTTQLLPVSMTKICSERITVHKRRESHCKSNERTNRSIETCYPEMLPEIL
jgi:hypothetical protein